MNSSNDGKHPLSVAIITKNEEKRLPECLQSVFFADDIVVVDSGSTDRTVNIAEGFGCRVYVEEWKGDGIQKNSAVSKCKNNWVLVLDADERLTVEAKADVIQILNNDSSSDAYSLPRKSIFHGRWIKRCGWWPDRVVRVFRKDMGRYHGITHGQWITTGSLKKLDSSLEHYSFIDYEDMLKRLNTYSTFRANELNSDNSRSNFFLALIHGIYMFFSSYVLKRGFLEGMDGFVIASIKAGGSFFKYAKLVEKQKYGKE